nr:hypothetical protein [uncultured Desulfobacter sp.]
MLPRPDPKPNTSPTIKNYYRKFKEDRDPWDEGAPDMADFRQVLMHWGITKKQLPVVRRRLAVKATLFAILAIWGCWYLLTKDSWVSAGIPAIISGSTVAICNGWRAQVLYRERFTYFKDWFLWGWFDWVGKETPIAQAERLKYEGALDHE